MLDIPVDLVSYFVITKFALGLWALLSAAEWAANFSLFRGGILSWQILKLRPGLSAPTGIHTVLYSACALAVVLAGRGLAGAVLLIPATTAWDFSCSAFILVSCFYISRRAVFGADGSDQMGMVIAAGVTITASGFTLSDRSLAYIGLFAIAGQAMLAYSVAGVAKVASSTWRQGRALSAVMNTRSFGHPFAARIADRRCASLFLCWTIIVTEALFPLVFLLPRDFAVVSLACFAFFHFANAYFMGLNAFVLPFLAAYPSVLLLNSLLRGALGWGE